MTRSSAAAIRRRRAQKAANSQDVPAPSEAVQAVSSTPALVTPVPVEIQDASTDTPEAQPTLAVDVSSDAAEMRELMDELSSKVSTLEELSSKVSQLEELTSTKVSQLEELSSKVSTLDELSIRVSTLGAEMSDIVTTLNDIVDEVNAEPHKVTSEAPSSAENEHTLAQQDIAFSHAEDTMRQMVRDAVDTASQDALKAVTDRVEACASDVASQTSLVGAVTADVDLIKQQVLSALDVARSLSQLETQVQQMGTDMGKDVETIRTGVEEQKQQHVTQVQNLVSSYALLSDDSNKVAGRVDELTSDMQHIKMVASALQAEMTSHNAASKETGSGIAKLYEALAHCAKNDVVDANRRAITRMQADTNQFHSTYKADVARLATSRNDLKKCYDTRMEDVEGKVDRVVDKVEEQNRTQQAHATAMVADITKGMALLETKLHTAVTDDTHRHLASVHESVGNKLSSFTDDLTLLKEEMSTMQSALDALTATVAASEAAAAAEASAPKKRTTKKKAAAGTIIEVLKDD